MKSNFKKALLVAMLCSGQVMAQQTINQVLTLRSNQANSTEVIMYKTDDVNFYSLFSNSSGFGLYNSNTAKNILYADINDRVGIGTSTPISNFQVKGKSDYDSSTQFFLTNNASAYGRTHLVLTGRFEAGNDAWLFGTGARNAIVFSQNLGGAVGDYGEEKFSLQLEGNSNSLGFLSKAKNSTPVLAMTQGGNVGIGLANPSDKLSVDGAIAAYGGEERQVLTYLPTNYNEGDIVSGSSYKWYGDIWTIGNIRSGSMPTGGFGISLNNNMNFKILPNGDVGIGTATPKEKLSVNGKIRAKEIKVEATNWPDYIFEEGYQKQSLTEIEQFIKENKHLPGVPTAKQVEQEGVELGEMNKILLKKIEELTLHLIEKEKKLDQINTDLKKKDEAIEALVSRIEKLEKK